MIVSQLYIGLTIPIGSRFNKRQNRYLCFNIKHVQTPSTKPLASLKKTMFFNSTINNWNNNLLPVAEMISSFKKDFRSKIIKECKS